MENYTRYGHNAGGARVLAMLDKVIADSKTVENEAIQDERDSQVAYLSPPVIATTVF